MREINKMENKLFSSPENKVYVKLERASDICFVDIPKPRSNSSFSYVQTLMFLNKQSAIKSSSLECLPNNSLALGIKGLYSSSGTKIILFKTKAENALNLFSESLDFNNISSLCLINSSLSFKGANILSLLSNKSLRIFPPEIIILNKTLESIMSRNLTKTTPFMVWWFLEHPKDERPSQTSPFKARWRIVFLITFIYIRPFFFKSLCIDSLTFSDNSSASFSVNLLSDIIFLAIANSNSLTSSFTTLAKATLNSCLNSDGTSTSIVISSTYLLEIIPYKKLSIWSIESMEKKGGRDEDNYN